MVFMYASGCFRRDTLVDPAIATSRLPVALGLAGAFLFIALHYGLVALYPADPVYLSISRCVTVVLLGSGISLCAAMLSLATYYSMARLHWFTRRILVIGTGARALHLRNLMSEASQKLANDLIFAPESVIGGACGSARDILREAIIPVGTETIEALARGQVVDEIVVAPDEGVGISLECLLACKT